MLAYDPNGRLWQSAGGASGVTRYLYDGDELVAEYDGAGALLRRYVHGAGEDDPILWYEGAGLADRRALQADSQGSIVSVAGAAGTRLAINGYDEYGIPGTANLGRFQYTGQSWLPDLGMYYYKARIYSPTLVRFLQTDPIGYDDQVNLYAYVGNDPVNGRDPSGLEGDLWGRITDVMVGVGELAVGTVGTITGLTIAVGGTVTELATLGISTPASVPATVGGIALAGISVVVVNDGRQRFVRGLTGDDNQPTISEARRSGPGPYRCSNPTCDAPHGGTTGTTECLDCAGKRAGGSALPGPKPKTLPPAPKPEPRPNPKPRRIKIEED